MGNEQGTIKFYTESEQLQRVLSYIVDEMEEMSAKINAIYDAMTEENPTEEKPTNEETENGTDFKPRETAYPEKK